jgi:hypothetical protein
MGAHRSRTCLIPLPLFGIIFARKSEVREQRSGSPYLFLTPAIALPNRNLTETAVYSPPASTGETDMSDLVFLALGGGTLLVLALYARALDRL